MTDRVHYDSDGVISTITLDDGKANVLSPAMLAQLNAAFDRAESEGTVLLLTGRTGMFSAGFDLAVFKQGPQASGEMVAQGFAAALRLLSFPAPVVIACSGHAIAMGAFLTLTGDVRFGVAGGAHKICVNEVQIGLSLPRFAIELCRSRLAPAYFNRALITAAPYAPEEALQAGFLDQLAPADALLDYAREEALRLSKLVRSAFTETKLRTRATTLATLREALASG